MTINRSKSNKIKRNKTKRRRQTKNKRRRQHGGTVKEYMYTPGSKDILKEGILPTSVLIPGYSEIVNMMEEYVNNESESEKLKKGIKKKEVHLLTDCSLQTQIDKSKIIVLRKEDKTRLWVRLNNSAIECTPEQYYAFASHNFRIFIEDMLEWNPFLNLPEHKKKEGYGNELYGTTTPHIYGSDKTFIDYKWWEPQIWWTEYKGTEPFITAAATAVEEAAAQPPSQSPPPVDVTLLLQPPQLTLNRQLSDVTTSISSNLTLAKSSLQDLIRKSKEKYKYNDVSSKIEELTSSVKMLTLITPQIDALLQQSPSQ